MHLLTVDKLQTSVFGPVSLHLDPGQTVCLSGGSGAGKSRLLRAIADLDPHDGTVTLQGESQARVPANQWRRKVGLLVAETAWWLERVGDHFPEREIAGLSTLGFGPDTPDWEVTRLSSGERQRLGLLRLLSNRPRVLLLDEPSANLDPDNVSRVEQLIREYRENTDAGVLWVSHDRAQIRRMADRHLVMENGNLSEAMAQE